MAGQEAGMAGQEGGPVREIEALIAVTQRCVDQLEHALGSYSTVLELLQNGSTVLTPWPLVG